MSMLQFDEEAARHIRRVYSTPDVVQQRAEVLALLAAQPGERVLDVGSGPGFLVASLADAVGPGGAVRGLDQSAPMNAAARDLIKDRPWAGIDDGDALTLPYPDAAFDAVVSTQVYEYVADIPRAFAELRRGLRTGGRAVVLDTDWDSVVWHVIAVLLGSRSGMLGLGAHRGRLAFVGLGRDRGDRQTGRGRRQAP